jgi:histidinol dehydrogenase
VRDLDQAAAVVDELAPEHLVILLADDEAFLEKVSVAGAIFLGEWSAVPFGDYGVASNHVLPTSGTARFSSGLRASDYVTVRSVVRMTSAAAGRHAPAAATIANAEGLVGHAKAVEARRDRA